MNTERLQKASREDRMCERGPRWEEEGERPHFPIF